MTLTWSQPCTVPKGFMNTLGEKVIIMMVHILDVVGDGLPLCHCLTARLRGRGTPIEVVHGTLPPLFHLLTVALLPKRIQLLGKTLIYENEWRRSVQDQSVRPLDFGLPVTLKFSCVQEEIIPLATCQESKYCVISGLCSLKYFWIEGWRSVTISPTLTPAASRKSRLLWNPSFSIRRLLPTSLL